MKIKHTLTAACFCAAFFFSNSSQAIKVTFGTKCHPDDNGGCTGERGICIIIEIKNAEALAREISPSAFLGDDMAYGELTRVDESHLRLDVLAQKSDVPLTGNFKVEQPVQLKEEVCRQLGLQSVVIQAGEYRVDYAGCRFGTILLDVSGR